MWVAKIPLYINFGSLNTDMVLILGIASALPDSELSDTEIDNTVNTEAMYRNECHLRIRRSNSELTNFR